MKTIAERYFFRNFIKISQELTSAEVRMLYLLITEPAISKLPQQEFADRIKAHRRTINIGLKKLKQLHYISDSNSEMGKGEGKELEIGNNVIQKNEEETAKKVINNSFIDYYKTNKKNFIVNEDFFSFILGDIRLPIRFRHNRIFVLDTIKDKYPEISFYSELKGSNDSDDSHFYIVSRVNSEIRKAKDNGNYRIKIDEIFQNAFNNYSLGEDEVLMIIKSYFSKIRLTSKGISLRKPYKGKQFE